MSSPDDNRDFLFGDLPRFRRRPPRRVFGLLVLGMLALGLVLVAWTLVYGVGSKSPEAASSDATSHTPTQSPLSPQANATLPSQLQSLVDGGRPVYCGGTTQPMVALTFDDGPGPYSQYTIDTLRTANAKATFFLVGRLLHSKTYQRIAKREAKFGEVGDHSWSHPELAGEPESTLQTEVLKAQKLTEKYTGGPVVYFRPPLGSHDAALDAYVRSLGMIEVIWTFDTHDSSEGVKPDEIVTSIDNWARPGAIILLHENRGATRIALPDILQTLSDKGLRPVTLTTLLTEDPPTREQLKQGQSGCTR